MQRKKRVMLILPRWSKRGLAEVSVFGVPPLGLYQLANVTPLEWDVTIIDESRKPVDFRERPDLVGISIMTPLASRGYEIADQFRSNGIPVVMGGIHVFVRPEEAMKHADALVIGEADRIWSRILCDLESGQLKKVYKDETRPDLASLQLTRDLVPTVQFIGHSIPVIQTQRGCPHNCEFCSVSAFNGRRIRCRPVGDIVKQIKRVLPNGGHLIFADDNIVAKPSFALELFQAMVGLKVRWMSQTDVRIATIPQLLESAVESGLSAVFIGFEALDREVLVSGVCRSKAEWSQQYEEAIKNLQRNGVLVEGSFIFGLDGQSSDVFEQTVVWAQQMGLDAAQFSVATPFPGTRLFKRLAAENRITANRPDGGYDWSKFDATTVVCRPDSMGPEELQNGVWWAYRKFYSWKYITQRALSNLLSGYMFNMIAGFVSSLQFRRIW